jgi:hypothetical protein
MPLPEEKLELCSAGPVSTRLAACINGVLTFIAGFIVNSTPSEYGILHLPHLRSQAANREYSAY